MMISPPDRAVEGLAARQAALDILNLVRAGAGLDDALQKCRSFEALAGSDRGFARVLATTVLRRQGTLDTLIGAYIERPLPKRAARIVDILRLAAAQSALLDTPDHAVVDTAVALAKAYRETAGYAGLVNAVARKIARTGKMAAGRLSERVDTPGWLWRAWERAYGPQTAKAIAAAHRVEPPLDLTLKRPAEAALFAEKLGASILPSGGLRLQEKASVTELAGFAEGAWWVQDAAASLPARLLGDIAGKLVYDLCAAPGGKTLQLAAAGARVIAVDLKGERLKLVAENLSRTGLKAETVKADVLTWKLAEKADAILLDAPCTATGAIRRHPDILWSKSEDDVAAMARIQARMIDQAVGLLKEGGLLVYATCSLQPEEGENQIEAALARHPRLRRVAIDPQEIGGLKEAVNRSGDLRTLPSMWGESGGIDGFFAARLRLSPA